MEPKIVSKANITQNITFNGSDKDHSFEVLAQDLTVHCSDGNHNHGSSKVKLTDFVDYNWELRFYVGQLLAVHISGNIIAYGIKGKSGGMVRIVNLKSNQRALIKDIGGTVQDLSFALIPQQIILAFVNEEGCLYVYNMEEEDDVIKTTLLLHVIHPGSTATNFRVIWCPYLPAYGEDSDVVDDPTKLLVFLNGNKAEVYDVNVISAKCGDTAIQPSEKHEGFVEVEGHLADIIDASLSPDGTALATASLDGYVKFFQIYIDDNENPRCLHEWQPHDGQALSCLMFLENIHSYGPKFWKFAVTGSNHNAELKLWTCESWTCLQTLTFVPNPNMKTPKLCFKARIDSTGHYLLLSEINNRILYVLQLEKNDSERLATVANLSEFLLPAPVLSFCITSAEVQKMRYIRTDDELYICEPTGEFDDESSTSALTIKLFMVQPKKLQECTITFQPENFLNNDNVFGLDVSGDTLVNLEEKTDADTKNETPKLNELQTSVNYLLQQQSQPLNLMTPEAFSSPAQTSSPNNKITSPASIKSEEETNLLETENVMNYDRPAKENFASAGSSPSREVQEILSFKNNQNQYFDTLSKIDDDQIQEQNDFIEEESLLYRDSASNDVLWPNIPIMKANEIVKEENRRQELKMATETEKTDLNNCLSVTNFQQLNSRLVNLETTVLEQNQEIQKLQREILLSRQDMKTGISDIKGTFSKELENALSRHQQSNKSFDSYVQGVQKGLDRDRVDHIVSGVSQVFNLQLKETLQSTVNHTIKHSVLPSVLAVFETLKHQLAVEYSQKLNSTDLLLKDNISKLMTNESVAEALSYSVVTIIKPSLEQCYREMIATSLVPSWERICGTMFQQIHETFSKGTKEYTASLEGYMEKQRKVQDKGKDLIAQMQVVSDTMKNNTDKLILNLSQEIQKQLNLSFANMQEKLAISMSNLIGEQVQQGFKSHVSILEDSVLNAVRSRTVTPSPHVVDTQVQLAQIQQLLQKGQIDVAFQQALSASDLSLVIFVCEKLSPDEVFKQGNALLPQPVILSLIQQLSADLLHHTELKISYLQEAVLSLETTNVLTREHMPIVLNELMRQLTNFIKSNPKHKEIRNMRVLSLVTQSLIIR